MEKVKREFRSAAEWDEFITSGCCHLDKIAVINTLKNECIRITRSVFHQIEVDGNSFVFVRVGAESAMQIIVKDNATAIVQRGKVIGKGESRIILYENSSAELTNKATGWAFAESRIILRQSSAAFLYGEASADVREKAKVIVGEYGTAECQDNSTAVDAGTTAQITAIGKGQEMPSIEKGSWLIKRKYIKQKKWAEKMATSQWSL